MANKTLRTFFFCIGLCWLFLPEEGFADEFTLEAIDIQREGLGNLIQYVTNRDDLFERPQTQNPLLNLDQKTEALNVWVVFLDYMSTLQAINNVTKDYLSKYGAEREERKQLHAFAVTTQYRFGLEFFQAVNHDAELVKLFNLAHPEQSISSGLYDRFRDQTLSDWSTSDFDRFMDSYTAPDQNAVEHKITENLAAIGQLNRAGLLATNRANLIGRLLYKPYYPLQKGAVKVIGSVKVWRLGDNLITPEQVKEFTPRFEPGDFHLTRKEWRLSNVGIPGYWSHIALYVGTAEERTEYFDSPEITQWLAEQGADSFEQYLQQINPLYADQPKSDSRGEFRTLEALDAGVVFNSMEASLDADSAAVFRPRLSKLEKAKAIANAFHYLGRPYDFKFDFDTDSALICSELIVKAFQPSATQKGIEFPLNTIVGRKILTPSEIAKWYDDTVGTAEQMLDLVMFIESDEGAGMAFEAPTESFVGTWNRPNWHKFRRTPVLKHLLPSEKS